MRKCVVIYHLKFLMPTNSLLEDLMISLLMIYPNFFWINFDIYFDAADKIVGTIKEMSVAHELD